MPQRSADIDRWLLDVVRQRAVHDQSELLEWLAARGQVLSQSALSRRLQKLGIDKRDGRYVVDNITPAFPALSLQPVPPNLLVMRTAPGFANALAVQLDQDPLPGQAGSIAGDDTVFVATDPKQFDAAQRAARSRFGIG